MSRFNGLTLVLSCLVPFFSVQASAAPVWVERNFIAASELLDARFLEHNPESAEVIDHSIWDEFLQKYLAMDVSGVALFRYRAVGSEDIAILQNYIHSLEGVVTSTLNKKEQLAFWINLYNALTVQLIIKSEPVESIRDLDAPWSTPVTRVNGIDLTLSNIENNIIRPVYGDNRIHYAVNCASIGCPNLAMKAYTGERLEEMLESAARDYITHPRGVRFTRKNKVIVSKIYGWYRKDFGSDEEAILNHIRQYSDEKLYRALEGKTSIRKYRYDWSLNIAGPL